MGSIVKAITEVSKATGYLILRDYQKKTLEAYLSGRDVFVSAPTGAGKSLTFELAPYAFDCLNGDQANSYSIALVVVPLISLMKDQVSNLNFSALLLLRVSSAVPPLSSARASLFTDVVPPFLASMDFLLRQESSELRFCFCLRNFATGYLLSGDPLKI